MTDLRVNICGTGAMACLFGAHLSSVARVTLVGTWHDSLTAIRGHGIRFEGATGGYRVNVAALHEEIEPAELVLVLVKTWQNGRIAANLRRLGAAGGVALTLQNGIGNREILGSGVCAGTTACGAALSAPGVVRPGGGGPTYAAAPPWVVNLLRCARFEVHGRGTDELEALLWSKLVVSCAINAVTALLRICNGELLRRPDAERLMAAAALECAAVAHAKGIVLSFDDPVEHTRGVAHRTAGNVSSMLQDVLRGAPTEVDAINGVVVREGNQLGIPAPVNEKLWRLVRAAVASKEGSRRGSDV